MRRVWAYLLVAIFGISLITPVLSADESPNQPACCRRLGSHHCAIQVPVGVAVKGVCGQYGRLATDLAQPEYTKAAVLKASRVIFAVLASGPAALEQDQALGRSPFSRSRQKRGPPSLSL